MKSALYIGSVRHRRLTPRAHDFRYYMAYFYLDLSETERLFRVPFLFADHGPSLIAFRRRDYFRGKSKTSNVAVASLDQSIRDLVRERLGQTPRGPIRVLTQLSYFGFCFNPVSIYYCFDAGDERVQFIVADVTNTPWKESHAYAVECVAGAPLDFNMRKSFHVSPFMPMEIDYRWRMSSPRESLVVHMESLSPSNGGLIFDATMTLKRKSLNRWSLFRTLVAFPLLTMKAVIAIYFEALRLKIKGLRFFPHPSSAKGSGEGL